MRRLILRATVLFALAAIGVFSVASTSRSVQAADNAKADIFQLKSDCGSPVTAPYKDIGFTNFHRNGNEIMFEYHLKDAPPNATFSVSLWGGGCTFASPVLGTITTNSNGVANGNFTYTLTGTQTSLTSFFATSCGAAACFNDTTSVTLSP